MPNFKTIAMTTIFSLSATWVTWAATGMSTNLQTVGRDRQQVVTFEGRKAERFELKSGDCYWDTEGKNSPDCKTGRERVEQRSTTYDDLDKVVCYSYGLYLPPAYGEMSVKSTLGQWHDGKYGDAISLRYMQGRMWFSHNVGDNEVRKNDIPFKKGQWNDFVFRLKPAHKGGEIRIWHNGKLVVDVQQAQIVPTEIKRLHFKYGIYRSHLEGVKNRPTQVAYYSDVSRFTGAKCDGL